MRKVFLQSDINNFADLTNKGIDITEQVSLNAIKSIKREILTKDNKIKLPAISLLIAYDEEKDYGGTTQTIYDYLLSLESNNTMSFIRIYDYDGSSYKFIYQAIIDYNSMQQIIAGVTQTKIDLIDPISYMNQKIVNYRGVSMSEYNDIIPFLINEFYYTTEEIYTFENKTIDYGGTDKIVGRFDIDEFLFGEYQTNTGSDNYLIYGGEIISYSKSYRAVEDGENHFYFTDLTRQKFNTIKELDERVDSIILVRVKAFDSLFDNIIFNIDDINTVFTEKLSNTNQKAYDDLFINTFAARTGADLYLTKSQTQIGDTIYNLENYNDLSIEKNEFLTMQDMAWENNQTNYEFGTTQAILEYQGIIDFYKNAYIDQSNIGEQATWKIYYVKVLNQDKTLLDPNHPYAIFINGATETYNIGVPFEPWTLYSNPISFWNNYKWYNWGCKEEQKQRPIRNIKTSTTYIDYRQLVPGNDSTGTYPGLETRHGLFVTLKNNGSLELYDSYLKSDDFQIFNDYSITTMAETNGTLLDTSNLSDYKYINQFQGYYYDSFEDPDRYVFTACTNNDEIVELYIYYDGSNWLLCDDNDRKVLYTLENSAEKGTGLYSTYQYESNNYIRKYNYINQMAMISTKNQKLMSFVSDYAKLLFAVYSIQYENNNCNLVFRDITNLYNLVTDPETIHSFNVQDVDIIISSLKKYKAKIEKPEVSFDSSLLEDIYNRKYQTVYDQFDYFLEIEIPEQNNGNIRNSKIFSVISNGNDDGVIISKEISFQESGVLYKFKALFVEGS